MVPLPLKEIFLILAIAVHAMFWLHNMNVHELIKIHTS
jgi:hypothetical protein